MYDFVTIDFETANENLNSACSIGIVAVKDLEIADYFESYIQPPYNRFSDNNIRIHGITPDITEHAPTMDELWYDISHFFSPHTPVIAHNAQFDMSVLKLSTTADIQDFPYIDSISVASLFMSGSKSLKSCAECFGIEMDHHHDALSDATAAAEIVVHALKECNCISMWEFLAYNSLTIKHFSELNPTEQFFQKGRRMPPMPSSYSTSVKPSELIPRGEVDAGNPLCGKSIVFTGELSISREEAWQLAVDCGAKVRTSVSRRTDYLVIGEQVPWLVDSSGLSSKEKEALAINAEGKGQIKLINQAQYYGLVGLEE